MERKKINYEKRTKEEKKTPEIGKRTKEEKKTPEISKRTKGEKETPEVVKREILTRPPEIDENGMLHLNKVVARRRSTQIFYDRVPGNGKMITRVTVKEVYEREDPLPDAE